MGLRRSLAERLRADFLAGLGIVLPAGLTVMLALWAVDFVDDKALPFLPGWFGEGHVAGLGLLAFLALTTLAGALLKGVAGRGVSTRTRSVSADPRAETTIALMPVPPMSANSRRFISGSAATLPSLPSRLIALNCLVK